MASTGGSAAPPCPDPSAHQASHKLSEQASSAALLAVHAGERDHPLGPDGKLSSKSAAASLKYARPQDLPSHPSHGIDTANSAGQAAMLAKDYKMKELWQPGLSAAGSKAALLAAKDAGKVELWQYGGSADGNSAAKLAMQKQLSPQIDYGYTKDGHSNALLAATKSQRAGRQRAGSTPVAQPAAYPDSANSAHNALNAATISHRAATKAQNPLEPDGWDSPANQAARLQNVSAGRLDPELFTEHPPIELEKQEKRDQAALRASAISMAKQMYEVQNRVTLGDQQSSSTPAIDGKLFASQVAQPPLDIKQEAMKYIHLQDAAHQLAQERLAKIDKSLEGARYREYYGYGNQPRSRLSTRLGRKRASSDTARNDLDSDDEENAHRVRNQMSQFNTALATVDAKKQQTDRDNLLAIAQKRVQQSMHEMDEKVYQDTGKVSQAMMDDWEAKARKRATDDAEKREVNKGKTHIGAGKYMDTAEIEAIAQARLQPTFDEISEVAERKRARDEEIRLDKAEQERQKTLEKQREREHKEIQKKAAQEQKAHEREEKATLKKEKEERKAAEAENEAAEPEHSKRRTILGFLPHRHKDKEVKSPAATPNKEVKPPVTTTDKETKVSSSEHDRTTALPIFTTTNTTPSQAPPTDAATQKVSSTTDRTSTTSAPIASKEVDQPASSLAVSDAKSDTASLTKSGGVKGFLAKLRHGTSKTDHEDGEKAVATTTADPEIPAVVSSEAKADKQVKDEKTVDTPFVAAAVSGLPQHVGTDGQIGDANRVSGLNDNADAASPSSFRRRDAEGNDADVSSLSSSGLEEEDLAEGRTGRVARALGLGKLKSKNKTAAKEPEEEPHSTPAAVADTKVDKEDEDDNDTFVEAQDTIDTTAASDPALAPHATAQPGRETKFVEEL